MFEIELFPARDGDCIVVRWGEGASVSRMLIDVGREGTWNAVKSAFEDLPASERDFELLVVTHIDADHISGVLKMLSDPHCSLRFKEVWFNGYNHLSGGEYEAFGPAQGEKLSDILGIRPEIWNKRFNHKAVVVRDLKNPPRLEIKGLSLTLLSPTQAKLDALREEWAIWLRKANLRPGDPDASPPPPLGDGWEGFGGRPDIEALANETAPVDNEPPNGSSIAFAVEYGGKRVLLTGDAHSAVLAAGLAELSPEERRFDLVKLSHHGSRGNLSADLLAALDARRFVISTNGSRHHHPDPQTLARLARLPGGKTFYFNYRHPEAALWDDAVLKRKYVYEAVYCAPGDEGRLVVAI